MARIVGPVDAGMKTTVLARPAPRWVGCRRPSEAQAASGVRSPPVSGLRPDLPIVRVASRAEWRSWLAREHGRSAGVWAVTTKKGALAPGAPFVSAADLNEECLCFGWIDSRPARIDDRETALLCTPRKAGSGWSKVNKDRIARLIAEGAVHRSGLDAIDRAKADGSWSRLDEVDALIVPADLVAALDALPPARARFDAFPPSVRRGILEWIAAAKTEATRQRRIDETATLAQRDERANQWPRRRPSPAPGTGAR